MDRQRIMIRLVGELRASFGTLRVEHGEWAKQDNSYMVYKLSDRFKILQYKKSSGQHPFATRNKCPEKETRDGGYR